MTKLAYRPAEVAVLLGLSECKVYQLLKENRLPSKRIDRRILVPRDALRKYLNETDGEAQV